MKRPRSRYRECLTSIEPFAVGIAFAVLLLLIVGCSTTPLSTGAACDALRPTLPTWSKDDTEQSKREGAVFLDVFEATCPE